MEELVLTAEEWALAASVFFSGLASGLQFATIWAAFGLFLVALVSL
jgi:hypothetical protein